MTSFKNILSGTNIRTGKSVLFVLCLVPLCWIAWDTFDGNLGANPVEEMTHRTGDWVLRFLLMTLAITPLRQIFKWPELVRLRRMLGLFVFFYVCLHFLVYIVFDHFFDLNDIVEDIIKRPYITVGFSAFVLLIPLVITSTNKMMKRLGRNWKKLHQLVYVIATLGILHFLWQVKADVFEPFVYGGILLVLLAYRAWKDAQLRLEKLKKTQMKAHDIIENKVLDS